MPKTHPWFTLVNGGQEESTDGSARSNNRSEKLALPLSERKAARLLAELPGVVYSDEKMDWPAVFGTSGRFSAMRFSAMADASARILFASSLFSAW